MAVVEQCLHTDEDLRDAKPSDFTADFTELFTGTDKVWTPKDGTNTMTVELASPEDTSLLSVTFTVENIRLLEITTRNEENDENTFFPEVIN